MGYRSELAVAMKPEAVPHFERACQEVAASPSAFFKTPLHVEASRREDTEDGVLFIWRSIKAYDLDDVVQAFCRRLGEAGFNPADEVFYAVRVGDRDDDVEFLGDWTENPFEITVDASLTYNA